MILFQETLNIQEDYKNMKMVFNRNIIVVVLRKKEDPGLRVALASKNHFFPIKTIIFLLPTHHVPLIFLVEATTKSPISH